MSHPSHSLPQSPQPNPNPCDQVANKQGGIAIEGVSSAATVDDMRDMAKKDRTQVAAAAQGSSSSAGAATSSSGGVGPDERVCAECQRPIPDGCTLLRECRRHGSAPANAMVCPLPRVRRRKGSRR